VSSLTMRWSMADANHWELQDAITNFNRRFLFLHLFLFFKRLGVILHCYSISQLGWNCTLLPARYVINFFFLLLYLNAHMSLFAILSARLLNYGTSYDCYVRALETNTWYIFRTTSVASGREDIQPDNDCSAVWWQLYPMSAHKASTMSGQPEI
jgi:hypothetical protein